ncbi:hypothetical protein [Paenibacillus sp. An7]|uniref:hypothetical protein n=1 Tax=Paenibacillus sp. An7 TaxID=2689577 RepID=UPI00135A751D|nr:hypothetical protein [Paenibacillus sp. An7]
MWMFIGLISFLGFIIYLVLGLVALVKKNGLAKKKFLTSLVLFFLFIVAIIADPSTTETADSEQPPTEGVEANIASDTSKNNVEATNDEGNIQKEAEEKAKAEAAAKAAEEKAKAEAEAEAKAAEEAKKSQTAGLMKILVPSITENIAEINDKTYNYLVENYTLFPAISAEAKQAAQDAADPNITTKHLQKNITPYLDKMISISGDVISIQEEETDYGTLAYVHIMDDEFNSVTGYYLGSTGDILEGDTIRLRGVPTAAYSFANVGGGTTNATLITISTIQKL